MSTVYVTNSDGRIKIHIKRNKPKPVKVYIPITNRSDTVVYNIRNGFMLAKPFDIYMDPTGWWASEKYDGVRAIWDGTKFYTRGLNIVNVPEEIIKKMPIDIALDGEFFIGRNSFNEVSGIVRGSYGMEEWKRVKYMVFDAPSVNAYIETRLKSVKQVVGEIGYPLIFAEQTLIKNREHLDQYHQKLIENGAEGTIIRAPSSLYTGNRSDDVVKLKKIDDEDAIITGWKEGSGKFSERLGSLEAKWLDPPLIKERYKLDVIPDCSFHVGSGLNASERPDILKAHLVYPLGCKIRVGFIGLQQSGKPRHPTFKGLIE
jgi:DNA ligase-1